MAPSGSIMTKRWTYLANLDLYKKVPTDLMEGTAQGSVLSWIVLFIIATLVTLETRSYMTGSTVEELALDTIYLHRKKSLWGVTQDQLQNNVHGHVEPPKLHVKFNITMMDLKCEYATIDVVSVLGAQQNVTKHVQKWMVSAEGVLERYRNLRNKEQHDLLEQVALHDATVTKTLEELHANGEDAVPLSQESLEAALKEYPFVFVDFFANWCSHCRLFAPTWEKLAEVMVDAKWHHHERVVQEQVQLDKEERKAQKRALEEADEQGVNINVLENITYTEEEYKKAEQAVQVHAPILVGKVDCVTHHAMCRKQNIMSYPTIRLFVNGEIHQDFFGSRTVVNLLQFLVLAEEKALGLEHVEDKANNGLLLADHADTALGNLNVTDEQKAAAMEAEKRLHDHWEPNEHPGCQIAGTLFLNKVPGNFYIQAQSRTHSLEPTLTNVSHEVHSLYFISKPPPGVAPPNPAWGLDQTQKAQDGTIMVPPPTSKAVAIQGGGLANPMNGNAYVTHELHQAHHHYIKLVSTNLYQYQVVQSSQMVHYNVDQVPEAKFIMDLSPIAVTYHHEGRSWYDYVTSLMAIVGGTFTVVGILDATLRGMVQQTRRVAKARQQRKQTQVARQQQHRELPRPPPQPTREAFQHSAHLHATNGAPAPVPQQRKATARAPLPRPPGM